MLGCGRVEFKTDIRNLRSRAAIARLGAVQEGILRAHRRRLDGSLRDSVLFSILASEWPDVRDGLRRKLARTSELERTTHSLSDELGRIELLPR